jgi:hypothetical protein
VEEEDARRIATIVPHDLERVKEGVEEQIVKREPCERQLLMLGEDECEDEDEERTRRVELGGSRTPEPTGLGTTYLHHLTTNNTDSKVDNDDCEPYNHEGEGAGAGAAIHHRSTGSNPPLSCLPCCRCSMLRRMAQYLRLSPRR